MRTRTLRTTVLLAALALTPALASARPWTDGDEGGGRVAIVEDDGFNFWRALLDRVTAIWSAEGGTLNPGG